MDKKSPEEVAKSFRQAMKGVGTDEARVIKEVITYTKYERQLIKQQYFTMYGHGLDEDLKTEIGGNFLKVVLGLLQTTAEFEAECMRDAIKGAGTANLVVIHLLCTKEAHEIHVLRDAYQRLYQRDLEKDLEKEEGGALGRMYRSLALATRPPSGEVNPALAKKEAQELYDAGQGKVGTDEIEFVRILCSRSFSQLRATFEAYYALCQTDIEKALKKEMSGNFEKACLAIAKCARNKASYFAEQIYESMKGIGTRDDDLIRLLVCRAEVDLPQIKHEYQRIYNKSLYDAVKSETSGDYKKILLELIGKDQ